MGRRRGFVKKTSFKRPFGQCPKCGGPVYPTGKKKREPTEMKAGVKVSRSPEVEFGRQWEYSEYEFKCEKCGGKFPASQIL